MKIEFGNRKKKKEKLLKKKQEEEQKRLEEEKKKNMDISGKKRVQELEKRKFYYEAVPFKSTYNLNWFQRRSQNKLRRKNPESIVLIKMEMANGMFREFLVLERFGCFTYGKGLYALDSSMKYYLIDRDIWAYDFHELISIPLRKKFQISEKLERLLQPEVDKGKKKPINPHPDINEIKTLIENSDIVDVEASINPTTLKRFTDSEVIKQVLQGAMLGRIFKVMFVLIVIIAIFMLILMLIQAYTSGLFEKLGGMF